MKREAFYYQSQSVGLHCESKQRQETLISHHCCKHVVYAFTVYTQHVCMNPTHKDCIFAWTSQHHCAVLKKILVNNLVKNDFKKKSKSEPDYTPVDTAGWVCLLPCLIDPLMLHASTTH